MVSVDYSENANEITVTTFLDRQVVSKVITCKATKTTVVEVYKEGQSKPMETYVYGKV